jgi:Lon protease-like protein
MGQMLPLFPLGTVLYPGLLLPLHVFEQRYRQLVRDLLERPEPRSFGVVAIRKGRETGVDGISALHDIGCTATLSKVSEHPDGRFDLITLGTHRFRLIELDYSRPYLQGEVELLAEETGEDEAARGAAQSVRQAFRTYLETLNRRGMARINIPELPDDPAALSYLVAASMIIDLSDRQILLAQPDTVSRLAAERALLSKEISMLRSLSSAPAPELRNSPYNPN